MSRQGKKGGEAGRNTGSAAPGREDSDSREQGALILKLAWEPVQFCSRFCLPRLKYSLHCPTELCPGVTSRFDGDGHWPFPLLRTMSSYILS